MSGWDDFLSALTDGLNVVASSLTNDESNERTTGGDSGRPNAVTRYASTETVTSARNFSGDDRAPADNRRVSPPPTRDADKLLADNGQVSPPPAGPDNASGRRKPDEEKEEIPTWAYVVGGAVALGTAAAVAYGAKKLYDSLSDNTPNTPEQIHSRSGACTIQELCLKDELEIYYQTHVKINPSKMDEAQRIVDEVIGGVEQHLRSKYPSLSIGSLQQVGSTTEDLKVVAPDEFDFMVPIGLDPSVWKLENAAHSDIHRAPGFWLLRKVNWSSSGLGNFMDGNYLSPAKIRSSFQGTLMQFFSNYMGRYRIRVSTPGPSVTLTVIFDSGQELSIDIVPTLSLSMQHVKIVGKPHPLSLRGNGAYDTLWRRSFSIKEGTKLRHMSTDKACHTKCLKILKAIRLGNAQLRMLSSYHLKTLLLHQMHLYSAESDWSHEALEDRFVGMVKALHSCVKDRHLPHFFTPEVNLLAHLQSDEHEQDALFNLEKYLARVIRKHDFASLLNT